MMNARQKILNYVLEEQSVTAEELSKVFKVTPANIRHHLSILVEQGSIKIIGQKTPPGKGRPTLVYAATQQCDRNNLEQLTDTLLSTLLANTPPEKKNALLLEIAEQMASTSIVDTHNPTRRVYSSIRALNRMGYQAHWEAHSEYPRIMLGHCPYMLLHGRHPEICQMDVFLLQELLDTPIHQSQKQSMNARGLPECVFTLSKAEI